MENTHPDLEDWTNDDLINEKRGHDVFLQRWKKNMSYGSVEESISDGSMAEVERGPSSKKPWECTVSGGEIIYFPDR
jgi:hypothetical protein